MKLKGAGFISFCAVLLFFSSALGEKLVEVSSAITKLRFLPSASSDTRGFARKGQRFVVDGESGQWFRIRLYNSIVWIAKDAVTVIESSEPPPAPENPAAATAQPGPQSQPGLQPLPGSPTAQPGSQPQPRTRPTPIASSRPSAGAGLIPAPAGSSLPGIMTAETARTMAALPESARAAIAAARTLSQGRPAESTSSPAASAARPARTFQTTEVTPTTPRKPFRPQPRSTWFSQFSRMPQVPSGEEGKEIAFFQVAVKDAPVLYATMNEAPVLARLKKGDYYPVLDSAGKWYKIAYADTAGWVERSKGVITTTPSSGLIDELMLILIIAAVVVSGAVAIIIVMLLRRRNKNKSKQGESFRAIIIARSAPDIQAVISNKTIALEKYLSAIGFSVKILRNPDGGQHFIEKFQPDVVFIDWNISSDISGTVEILFAGFDEKKLPLGIFYNVPDLSDIPLVPVLLRAYHLGAQFSDHDISKLITPTMLSRSSAKPAAASALEGDIAEGNLPEILQFIEIGKKTGCLLIDTDSPMGMIYFAQGRIIHAAATNGVTGRPAIYSLLKLTTGHFRFLLNKQPKSSDLNLSTLEVLMEWTKTEDEARRG